MRRTRLAALVAALMIATLTISGCSGFRSLGGSLINIISPNRHNDFAEANLRIKAKEAEYTKQRLVVVDADGSPREGVMTVAQYRKFQALEQNVIDATKPLYDTSNGAATGDIAEWRRTNTKPADYQAHERTLFAAIDELITYVKREAVKP